MKNNLHMHIFSKTKKKFYSLLFGRKVSKRIIQINLPQLKMFLKKTLFRVVKTTLIKGFSPIRKKSYFNRKMEIKLANKRHNF